MDPHPLDAHLWADILTNSQSNRFIGSRDQTEAIWLDNRQTLFDGEKEKKIRNCTTWCYWLWNKKNPWILRILNNFWKYDHTKTSKASNNGRLGCRHFQKSTISRFSGFSREIRGNSGKCDINHHSLLAGGMKKIKSPKNLDPRPISGHVWGTPNKFLFGQIPAHITS